MYTQMRVVLFHISSIAADIGNEKVFLAVCQKPPTENHWIIAEKNQAGDVILEITTTG